MNVLEAMRGRSSIRAFLNKEVSQETLRDVLEAARWAPSGTNTQPWQVAVVRGESKQKLCDQLVQAYREGQKSEADYQYYPDKFEEPFKSRRFACGKALYNALSIERGDREARKEQWIKNYRGFDAPAELFIFIDESLQTGSWLDLGMFIQNILLAAREFGLETCAQAAMSEYPDIIRGHLDMPKSMQVVCGIAIGYPDPNAPENQYRTEREPVNQFTQWHGW